ncbi:MAG: 50S ribosomal protein L33 [Phycisphaerae bacterium]|jgi:large subunit ribosomal protein L33|nr:50S ribosomal protein L33 [Phycisphaerae bacterium]
MAKSKAREYVWMQCSDCGSLNYRTNVRTQGGMPKLSLKKYCRRDRKHTNHKLKRK